MTDKEKEALKALNFYAEHYSDSMSKTFKEVLNVIKNKQNRITELEKIEEAHRELNGELRKELQLKEKMIDEIIDEYAFSDGINIRNFCDEQLRKDKCIENCDKCIKEYFTKKASEENE